MSDKDLKTLIPDESIQISTGEEITIRPFPFAKLPKVVAALNRVGTAFFAVLTSAKIEGDNLVFDDSTLFTAASSLIENHFEDVTELMACFCNKPAEWFRDEESGPNFEEGVLILIEIIRHNKDFFTKRLRQQVAQLTGSLAENGQK